MERKPVTNTNVFSFELPVGIDDDLNETSYVNLSGITGLQIGNGNAMSIAGCATQRPSDKCYKSYPKTPPPVTCAFGKGFAEAVATACGGATATATASSAALAPVTTKSATGIKTTVKKNPQIKRKNVEIDDDSFTFSEMVNVLSDVKTNLPSTRNGGLCDGTLRCFREGYESGREPVIVSTLNPIRCYCHGILGKSRFCFHQRECDEGIMWLERMSCVRKCADEVLTMGPLRLFNAVMTGAKSIVEKDPVFDLELAEQYVETTKKRTDIPLSKFYTNCERLRPDVVDFFGKYGGMINCLTQRVNDRVGTGLGRGLYSVVNLIDRCGNTFQGREETPVAIFARVSAAIAVASQASDGSPWKLLSSQPKDVFQVFDAIMSAVCSYAVIFPEHVLAYAGLRGQNPLFGSVSYRPQCQSVEATFNGTLKDVCEMLTNGISVSLSVSDLGGDCEACMHILGQTCRGLRETARFDTTVTLYVDIWSSDVLKVLSFATGPGKEFGEIRYAVNVPRLFWDRQYGNTDKQWTMFPRCEASALARVDLKTFQAAYERMEKDAVHLGVTVSPWWLACELAAAVTGTNTSVINCHNVQSPIVEGAGRPQVVCGPHLSSVLGAPIGVVPVQDLHINLENCVLEGPAVESMEDVVLGLGCRFSFVAMRALVRDAVVIGNVLLDMLIQNGVYGSGNMVALYRPLHINVTGFHDVLGRLGLRYSEGDSFLLNRRIWEYMYFQAVRASVDLCMCGGVPFPRFRKSIYASGKFIPDLYDEEERGVSELPQGFVERLREDVVRHGIRNCSFVFSGSGEEASRFSGTSPGCWPRNNNMRLEDTVIRAQPSTRRIVEDSTRFLKVYSDGLNEKVLAQFSNKERVKLPIINRRLMSLPSDRASVVIKRENMYALEDVDDDEDIHLVETTMCIPLESVVKMCVDRMPFVDHCQAVPIAAGIGGSPVVLTRHLKRMSALGLAVGVYKWSVPSLSN
nr:ribonucleotide reductase subunit 1 [Mastomys natalensis cytomegalovirus 3]WEG70020.1 ribonucleotide reductase subunit 1 [Mastomys natalensis cytomegalovirus 3]WEG70160.1 ribonucleotide reductase subunit 1 [Mastomys natalensis cytomegalovirus 3]WEG70720.1 ribonucleotide reductase subunit 1 [Mastomys natalensis cytomegalovirus 3]